PRLAIDRSSEASVVAYRAKAATPTSTRTAPRAGSCSLRRPCGAVAVITEASTTPVTRPPRWACQAMPGTTKPSTALTASTPNIALEDRPRWRLSTSRAPNSPKTAPEAPTTGTSQLLWSRPSWVRGNAGGEQQVADGPAERADQIQDGEPEPAQHGLEVLPDLPQREHIEQDVQHLAGGVREGGGQKAPRLAGAQGRHERELAGHLRGHHLHQPHGRADHDDRDGDHRAPVRGDLGTELRARHTHALLALTDAVDALDAD